MILNRGPLQCSGHGAVKRGMSHRALSLLNVRRTLIRQVRTIKVPIIIMLMKNHPLAITSLIGAIPTVLRT